MTSKESAPSRAREYETIYVLRPDVTRDAAERVAARVNEAVQREGGKLTLVETWGRRALAYPLGKHRRGVYVYLKYLGHGTAVNELERNLKMLDDVLRYQTVQVRAEVDAGSVQVDPEQVRFDAIEPPQSPEEEVSLERRLGLADAPEERQEREAPEEEAAFAEAATEEDA